MVRTIEPPSSPPQFVSEDRRCGGCGYNLKGLPNSGNCPECGRPIARRRRGPGFADHLVQAPLPWLLAFRLGAVMLTLSAAAFIIFQTLALVWPGQWAINGPMGLVVVSIAWGIAVWIVTRPRPLTPGSIVPPDEEWRRLRGIARVSSACLVAAALANVVIARALVIRALGTVVPLPPPPSVALLWAHGIALFLGGIGLVCFCVYLSNLCFWAADTTLAINFRACSFIVAMATIANGVLSLVLVFTPPAAGPGWGLASVITWPVMVGAGVFLGTAVLHLLWCLWRFQSIASWAVIHHATAESQTERMRARASELRAETRAVAQAPRPPDGPEPIRRRRMDP